METTYGLLSVLPVAVVVVLALITKNATFSLLIGAVAGCLILVGGNVQLLYGEFMDILNQVLMAEDTVWVALVITFFGGLIMLLRKTGGVVGFTKLAEKLVKTKKHALFATWVLGIIIFIDDYLNNLAVGTVMVNITDKYKVSRQMLTFIVTSTGATICAVLPMSSWGIFMMAQMDSSGMAPGIAPMELFLKTMPFIFYGWLAVLIVPLFLAKIIPLFGPMKKAEAAAESLQEPTEECLSPAENSDAQDVPIEKQRAVNFLIPVLLLTAMIMVTGDIQIGTVAAMLVGIVLIAVQRIKTFMEGFNIVIDGMTDMFPMAILLFISYVLLEVNARLGLTDFVINSTIEYINPSLFAVSTFILVAVLAFGTGTFWGLAVIAFPVMIPFSLALGANVYVTAGAIISGCTIGAHTCFFGDTVILACSTTKTNCVDYFKCAAPLCCLPGIICIIMYTIAGFVF